MPLPSGTRLGPREVLSPFGEGALGEIYKAKNTRLDRTVAVKVLPEHLAESAEAIAFASNRDGTGSKSSSASSQLRNDVRLT